jgi:hypothetical protein
MREAITGRDRTLPTPRALCPGERMVAGRVLYSAAWLDASEANPDLRDLEPGEAGGTPQTSGLFRAFLFDDAAGKDGRGASKADLRLRARAKAAREVIRDDPDVDRLGVLAMALWPSAKLLAFYG